jgi:hypothetical protein
MDHNIYMQIIKTLLNSFSFLRIFVETNKDFYLLLSKILSLNQLKISTSSDFILIFINFLIMPPEKAPWLFFELFINIMI